MRRAAALALLICAWGCDLVDRPNKPVPDEFVATALDGTVLGKKELKGQAWEINFWLPG